MARELGGKMDKITISDYKPLVDDIKKYYENTENALPNPTVRAIIEMNIKPENAIDLGCGAGRDTVYLIKNGWNVLAVDKENVEERIAKRLTSEELQRFKFKQQSFENIRLEKTKLIVANYSLPFCNKDKFEDLWNDIKLNIQKDGYFIGNFFGINDSWHMSKAEMKFLSKEQVIDLFSDFEILLFREVEEDGKTGLGKMKHWHVFHLISRRK